MDIHAMTTGEAITELRAARRAWHEAYGVPICEEYARFLQAIGNVEDKLVEFNQDCAPLPAKTKRGWMGARSQFDTED
jgi:hypothetical protein